MIQNIDSSPFQSPQQAWTLNESGLDKQNSIQKNRTYSYTSSEMMEVQYISLDSSSDPSKALDLFFSNLKEVLTGVIGFENANKLFPYSNTDTPDGFAGSVLNRIQEQYANIEASVIPPADDTSVPESTLLQAVQMEELNEPAEISPDQTQEALAEEIQVQPVVDETKQQFLDRVENGVSKGFQETISYLSQSVLREQSIQTVKEADQLIQKGIQSLRGNQPTLRQESGDMLEMQGESESRELNLEILTKDGDRVKIEINMDSMSESVRYQYGDEGKKIKGKQISDSTDDFLSFSIQGELDPEELNAISDLISEITTLADKFYSGNFQDAFSQATGMGNISDELSGFTLDLRYEKSAYAAYVTPETQAPAYENKELAQPASGNYQGTLMKDVQKLADHQGFTLFEKPLDLFKDIFLALQEPIESVSPDANHQNPDLITRMLEKALSRTGNAGEADTDLLNLPFYRTIDYFS
ncbi:MAG: hypothetical protein C0403_16710 [Desulfobacterium sp.]|nr:hypothetical protein [Desulfobacterium sp.]